MSVTGTANATEQDLRSHGLLTKGDIISIKNFCQGVLNDGPQKEKNAKKVELLERILQKNKTMRKQRDSEDWETRKVRRAEKPQVSMKVQLGWVHYD